MYLAAQLAAPATQAPPPPPPPGGEEAGGDSAKVGATTTLKAAFAEVSALGAAVDSVVEKATTCRSVALGRIGTSLNSYVENESGPGAVKLAVQGMSDCLRDVGEYVLLCAALATAGRAQTANPDVDGEGAKEYYNRLSVFCRIHDQGPNSTFNTVPVNYGNVSRQAMATLGDIKTWYSDMDHDIGAAVLGHHVDACVHEWVQTIVTHTVIVNAIHPQALEGEPIDAVFGMLVATRGNGGKYKMP